MFKISIRNSIGLLALIALSACANQAVDDPQPLGVDNCPPPYTLTCDRFAGENHNCSCERSDRLQDILDSY